MGEAPKSGSWKAPAASTHELRLWIDPSAGQHGWDRAYEAGRLRFNELLASYNIHLQVVSAPDRVNADVFGSAADGDLTFPRPNQPDEVVKFDPNSVHGFCRGTWEGTVSGGKTTYLLAKAQIFVPARAGLRETKSKRRVGEGVRTAIVVHELIHAAGLQDNSLHTTNDVFAWPGLEIGATADDDKFIVVTGNKVPLSDKFPDRMVPEKAKMPPIIMREGTARMLTAIWGTRPSP